jgi:hypothetical protein
MIKAADERSSKFVETGKQNFMRESKRRPRHHGNELRKHSPAAAGRLSARVMALVRRSFRPPGMPDAFDRAPLR